MLIDSHAHLDVAQFDEDRDAVLERARAAGVEAIISIGTDISSSRAAIALAAAHPHLHATAGVHPHEAGRFDDAERADFHAIWSDGQVVGVGEMGLDYYYDFAPRQRQREVMSWQLEAARTHQLPAIFHVRDAFDDFFAVLGERALPAGGVLHCFTGGPKECDEALARGLYISLSGIVTFPRANELQAVAKAIPSDRLLVETDAPYLAPVPERGKRNEPSFVAHTARFVAKLREQSFEELSHQTSRNTTRLFNLT